MGRGRRGWEERLRWDGWERKRKRTIRKGGGKGERGKLGGGKWDKRKKRV